MKIYIGSDHAGFEMKRFLIPALLEERVEVIDCGPKEYNHDDDYPDYISLVASEVSKNPESMGVVMGWSGQGESMVANRFSNVRCATYYGGTKHAITLSREHNNSNMLSIGAHFVTNQEAKEVVLLWIHTRFGGDERHRRRIKKIEQYD